MFFHTTLEDICLNSFQSDFGIEALKKSGEKEHFFDSIDTSIKLSCGLLVGLIASFLLLLLTFYEHCYMRTDFIIVLRGLVGLCSFEMPSRSVAVPPFALCPSEPSLPCSAYEDSCQKLAKWGGNT